MTGSSGGGLCSVPSQAWNGPLSPMTWRCGSRWSRSQVAIPWFGSSRSVSQERQRASRRTMASAWSHHWGTGAIQSRPPAARRRGDSSHRRRPVCRGAHTPGAKAVAVVVGDAYDPGCGWKGHVRLGGRDRLPSPAPSAREPRPRLAPSGHVSRQTASVLFTDLVGSTELRGRLGEEAADELRRKHDQLLAQAVEANNGRVIKGLGDGIMATFAGASDAVSAAVAIQQAVDRLNRSGKAAFPLTVRAGLSAGDVSFEDDD